MLTGTVKWFDRKKGYGFIVKSDGLDVFVHYSVIEGEGFRCLEEGETVSFKLALGVNGLFASKVVREPAKRPAQEPQSSPESAARVA